MTHLAIITGTSRGIGAGIAAAAHTWGAAVAVCNRTPTGAEAELTADLSDPGSWSAFARWYDQVVTDRSPERVVFIHNSATLTPIGFAGDVDPEAFQRLVLLDSAAPQVLGDTAIRIAGQRATSTTVMQLSSGAATSPYPGWSGYCASKAAVEMWVKAVATELDAGGDRAGGGERVRVAAIRPGVVDTGMQAEIRSSETDAFPNVDRFRHLHSSGALGDPAAVGARIWEASVATGWASGAILDVNQPIWE